jgi:hypothetical protein
MAKHPFSVPEQVASLATQGCLNRDWAKEPHSLTGIFVQVRRHNNFTRIRDSDEALVEGGVEVGGQEQPVVNVEAFGVGFAGGPGLDVAGTQKLRDGQPGDGAAAFPVVQQALPEDVLSYALDDQAFGFG